MRRAEDQWLAGVGAGAGAGCGAGSGCGAVRAATAARCCQGEGAQGAAQALCGRRGGGEGAQGAAQALFHPLHAVLNQAANCELEGILVGRGSGGSPQGVGAGGRRQ